MERFIAATNANDVVPRYLRTGTYTPAQTMSTISNAMDVGDPSNFARIEALFGGSNREISRVLSSSSITDDDTRRAIGDSLQRYRYILDPHGAVAYSALQRYRADHPDGRQAIILETAHPAKFPDVYEESVRKAVDVPARLQEMMRGTKRSVRLPNRFEEFKGFLLQSRP
jgi:threonine synthase